MPARPANSSGQRPGPESRLSRGNSACSVFVLALACFEAGGARSNACTPKATGPQALRKEVSRVTKASRPKSSHPTLHPTQRNVWLTASEELGCPRWLPTSESPRDAFWNPGHRGCTEVSPGQLRETGNGHRVLTCPKPCKRHLAAASNTASKRRELCGMPPTCSGPGSPRGLGSGLQVQVDELGSAPIPSVYNAFPILHIHEPSNNPVRRCDFTMKLYLHGKFSLTRSLPPSKRRCGRQNF